MKFVKLNIIFISILWSGTPAYFTFGFENGYDSNVLRLSEQEQKEAAYSTEILGGMNTFDSHILKGTLNAKKDIYFGENPFRLTSSIGFTHYTHSPKKQYESFRVKLAYKFGSYKKWEYSFKTLNQFYLRHYIDRDISNSQLAACLFTDNEQKVGLSYPIMKRTWVNGWIGYLQRYYDAPFTEFDLDIYFGRIKLNKSFRKFGTASIQFEQGRAMNISYQSIARASDFDRSYSYYQLFIPINKTKQNKWLDSYGVSTRVDFRFYDAENIGDPLHAGRNHLDMKLDFWCKKKITKSMVIKTTVRHRSRKTDSQFEWVKALKSFNQWQIGVKLEWDMIYDQY